jgi:hypothetical protein
MIGNDHTNLDGAVTESDSHRWRVRMTRKLMKYFRIPWLDRIVVRMETFRTTDTWSLSIDEKDEFDVIDPGLLMEKIDSM